MSEVILVDHEQRLTRLEDRVQINLESIAARLEKAEALAARLDALQGRLGVMDERDADLKRRLDALDDASPALAGSIGLDRNAS